ncbi:MAG TPA: cytochrome b5 domain-containing protein [Clostridiaceae bacterium]
MNKKFIAGLIGISIFLVGCSSVANTPKVTTNNNSNQNTVNTTKTFTVSELSKYDGKNGNSSYVAIDGVVYDVTNARAWRNGNHQGGAVAGKDLSKLISMSPHGSSVLANLPIVGKLQ